MVLGTIILAYTIVFSYLSLLRYENFFTGAWDLGINQQMLWSTGHGRLLYEAADYSVYGTHSFLAVHSTYIALAVVPLYQAFPFPTTLFALQSLVLAAAIVPLYLISIELLESRRLVFAVIGLYLFSFATTSGLLYDFHWEAFVPLEFLWLWYFYTHGRILPSFVMLAVGCCTLEVFPFFAVMVPIVVSLDRRRWIRWPVLSEVPRAIRGAVSRAVKRREGRIGLSFILACLLAYGVLRAAEVYLVPYLAGAPAGTTTPGVVGGGFAVLVAFGTSPLTVLTAGAYWVLFLAAVGFLPLLRPKYLLLLLPWFLFVTFNANAPRPSFGDQYSLLVIGPMIVTAVYGLARICASFREAPSASTIPLLVIVASIAAMTVLSVVPGSAGFLTRSDAAAIFVLGVFLPLLIVSGLVAWRFRVACYSGSNGRVESVAVKLPARAARAISAHPRSVLMVAVIVLVGFNLVMGPMNTVNYANYPGYRFAYSTSPVTPCMGRLTSQIPGNAPLLASDFLFPYVANDPNAVPLPWFDDWSSGFPFFPFTASNLPEFVLVDSSEFTLVPDFLQPLLWNTSIYGLLGDIYSTAYPGTVYLFEFGYHGSATTTNATAVAPTYYLGATNLSVGPEALIESNATSRFGQVIATNPLDPFEPGDPAIWYGPGDTYPAGTYRVTLNLSLHMVGGGYTNNTPVLVVNVGPQYLRPLYQQTLDVGDIGTHGWSSFEFNLSLVEPYPLMEIRGYAEGANTTLVGLVGLNYIELQMVP
jgi:uncharacterized membrane protein